MTTETLEYMSFKMEH